MRVARNHEAVINNTMHLRRLYLHERYTHARVLLTLGQGGRDDCANWNARTQRRDDLFCVCQRKLQFVC